MKAFYLSLALLALTLMVMQSVITFATTSEEATVSQMERVPEKWKVAVLEDNFYFSKGDEEEMKAKLLRYFIHAGSPTYSKVDQLFKCLAIVFAFCLIGFFRERWLQRNKLSAEQDGAGQPATRSESK